MDPSSRGEPILALSLHARNPYYYYVERAEIAASIKLYDCHYPVKPTDGLLAIASPAGPSECFERNRPESSKRIRPKIQKAPVSKQRNQLRRGRHRERSREKPSL
jgi:hypothetical protein